MDNKLFKEFVNTHAQRMETETLQAVATSLGDLIALRRSGKPAGLALGSCIEAVGLDVE